MHETLETVECLRYLNLTGDADEEVEPLTASLGRALVPIAEHAQQAIVSVAKDLAAKGEIMLADGGADDELIY